jgi:hypothetical protein
MINMHKVFSKSVHKYHHQLVMPAWWCAKERRVQVALNPICNDEEFAAATSLLYSAQLGAHTWNFHTQNH